MSFTPSKREYRKIILLENNFHGLHSIVVEKFWVPMALLLLSKNSRSGKQPSSCQCKGFRFIDKQQCKYPKSCMSVLENAKLGTKTCIFSFSEVGDMNRVKTLIPSSNNPMTTDSLSTIGSCFSYWKVNITQSGPLLMHYHGRGKWLGPEKNTESEISPFVELSNFELIFQSPIM